MSEETTNEEQAAPTRLSKPALLMASIFLTAPACIPFWYAMQQEDTVLTTIFIGAGFSLVIFNAIALVLIYRWIQRINES